MKNKKHLFYFAVTIALLTVSILSFTLQTFLFHDTRQSFFLLFQDFIFMPIEVILVSILIDKFISSREKRERLSKLNILVSEYFSEAGNDIIICLNQFVSDPELLRNIFTIETDWDAAAFRKAERVFLSAELKLDAHAASLSALYRTLLQKKRFLLTVFENPNTLEHSSFTDTALAIHHLLCELRNYEDLTSLPDETLTHLSADLKRAYDHVVLAWISNMKHLCQEYPYLYSLAVRKNIFLNEPDPSEHPCTE